MEIKRGGTSPRTGDFSPLLRELRGRTILGINSPVCDFAWFDLWSKPVGLLTLLHALRQQGNDVYLVDCLYEGRTTPLDFGRWKAERSPVEKPEPYRNIPRRYYRFGIGGAALRERLASCPKPDVVLVTSAMTYWYPGVFEAIRAVGEVFPDVPVLLGGAYARLCPEHALKSGADFVQTEFFPHASRFAGMIPDLYERPEYGVLITSWGCPMHCDYCAARRLWPGFAQRPAGEILADLDMQMSCATITDLAFYDDALLLNRERHFYPICEYIRKHYPNLRLHTPNGLHVAQLDGACCDVLFRTGFRTIRLSLEGTDRFTEEAGSHKTKASDYVRAVEALRRAGYTPDRIETYVLVGLPGQRFEDIRASIELVGSVGGRAKPAEFSPIPGTPLYETALGLNPEIADEPLLHNNTIYAPYVARTVTPEELQALKDLSRRT